MFFDLHNDFATVLAADKYGEYIKTIGDGIVTAAIWTTEFEKSSVARRVKEITLSASAHKVPVAIEDIGFVGEGDFDFSPYLYCSLTWNYNNVFAGGALDDGALTSLGHKIIDRINSCCALDLAHINRKSFFQALDAAKRPMCSHTGFNNHPRSLTDEQIKALIDRRGIIGLSAVTAFTGAKTVRELAQTVDRFVQKYGIHNIALGTDFYGTTDLPDGFNDYGGVGALKSELNILGYDDGCINKILYENALCFYEEIKGEGHLRKPADYAVRRQKDGGDFL